MKIPPHVVASVAALGSALRAATVLGIGETTVVRIRAGRPVSPGVWGKVMAWHAQQ